MNGTSNQMEKRAIFFKRPFHFFPLRGVGGGGERQFDDLASSFSFSSFFVGSFLSQLFICSVKVEETERISPPLKKLVEAIKGKHAGKYNHFSPPARAKKCIQADAN